MFCGTKLVQPRRLEFYVAADAGDDGERPISVRHREVSGLAHVLDHRGISIEHEMCSTSG
jgi:hypothetical protein